MDGLTRIKTTKLQNFMKYKPYGHNIIGFIGTVLKSNKTPIQGAIATTSANYGCCGHMHSVTPKGTNYTLCYPLNWLDKQIDIEQMVEIFNEWGASLEILGYVKDDPKLNQYLINHNSMILGYTFNGMDSTHEFSDPSEFVVIAIQGSDNRTKLQNYFSFNLIRSLFSSHYQTLFTDMLNIKKVTDYDWFTCFQLAHSAHDYVSARGFKLLISKITTLDKFKEAMETATVLNNAISGTMPVLKSAVQMPEQKKLFQEGKYEELRTRLT